MDTLPQRHPLATEHLADDILKAAMAHAATRIPPEVTSLGRAVPDIPVIRLTSLLRRGHAQAHEHLRYGAALRIARALSELDPTMRAVYLLEAEDAAAPATATISLILRVHRKTAALDALLQDLDDDLTRRYRALVGSRADGLRSLLATGIVDEGDVREGRGWAAQLFAHLQLRPIVLWSTDAGRAQA